MLPAVSAMKLDNVSGVEKYEVIGIDEGQFVSSFISLLIVTFLLKSIHK